MRALPLLLPWVVIVGGCSLFAGTADPPVSPPTITAIDGDGDARAVTDAAVVDGAVPATRRLRTRLVVSGEGLVDVTAAHIEQNGDIIPLEVLPMTSANNRPFRLPAGIVAGALTLVLTASAGEARAQVFLLQGEPGPTGPAGPAGPAGPEGPAGPAGADGVDVLSDDIDADTATCVFGGTVVRFGRDEDGDGVLDDEEVEASQERCAVGVEAPRQLDVNTEAELQAALAALAQGPILAPVQIRTPALLTMTTTIDFDHPDLRHVTFLGRVAGATIRSTVSPALRVVGRGLTVSGLAFERDLSVTQKVGIGVLVADPDSDARIVSSSFTGFGDGVQVTGGAAVFAGANTFSACFRGLRADSGGRVRNTGTMTFTSSDTGIDMRDGATAALALVTSDSPTLVIDGATFGCSSCTLSGRIDSRGGATLRLSNTDLGGSLTLFDTATAFVTAVGTPGAMSVNSGSTLRLTGVTGVEVIVGSGGVAVVSPNNTCRTDGTGVCRQE